MRGENAKRVVLIDTESPVPAYHGMGHYEYRGGEFGEGALVTWCGRPWLHYKNGRPLHGYAAVLRRDHAEAFGRECARCFR